MSTATSEDEAGGVVAWNRGRLVWVLLGLVSIAFHLGLVFSGLVQALVARPLHMGLALPWLFVFMAKNRVERVPASS